MASAETRSRPGPGISHGTNPGSSPKTIPWQPLEQGAEKEKLPELILELKSRLFSEKHAASKVNGSKLKTYYRKIVLQSCLQAKLEIQQTLATGKTKRPNLNVRQRFGSQQNFSRSHGRHGERNHASLSCEDLKVKPGQRLLPTNDQTSGLTLDPKSPSRLHCCQEPERKTPEAVEPGAGSKEKSTFESDAGQDVDRTFRATFLNKLHHPIVPEPRLNSRTLQTHASFRSCLNSHLRPLFLLILLFFLASFIHLTHAGPPRPACPPLLSGQPFIVFWGLKDSCSNRPDFRSFGIEPEGRVAVFYEDTLGNYPYFVNKDTPVNGGLPQHTKLDLHIQKTQGDVETALPAPRYLGLGVVRWQEWFPQWSRSRDKQDLYLNATRKLLRRFFPDWTQPELERWSKVDFEAAAQSVMTETLREVQRSRPKALWGMCPYPSCSNGSPAQTALSNYTGECPEEERSQNDQLLWLWRRSNAIYPLLTLEKIQAETRGATLFLSNQIREALRVASLGGSSDDLPVFPLVRSVYASTNTFLSLSDLVTTIGESAALGTAGIVIWDKTEAKTERECEELRRFTSSVLGPYVSNVTAASRLCSASLCQNRGRCVRLDQDKSSFLHLPPNTQDTADTSDEATDQPDPSPRPDPDPAELWKRDFQCQWFSSADRDVSDQQSPKDGSPSVGKREDSVGRGLDVLATVSDGMSTTTGAYRGQNGESVGSVSPKTTLETPVDRGATESAPRTMVLLLLLLVLYLWT